MAGGEYEVNGAKIKELLKEQGMSQASLVRKTGFSKRTIERFVAGEPARAENLARVAEILDVETKTLWANYEPPPEETTWNNPAILRYLEDRCDRLRGELAVTQMALETFFKILDQQQVPLEDLDAKLREMAQHYKELQARLRVTYFDDSDVIKLKQEALYALEELGDFKQAQTLLHKAADCQSSSRKSRQEFIKQQQDYVNKELLSEAEIKASLGKLAMVRLSYMESASYFQQATELTEQISEGAEEYLSVYLTCWGSAAIEIDDYQTAESVCKRAYNIQKSIGIERLEITGFLHNLGKLYYNQGRNEEAEMYFLQILEIQNKLLGENHPKNVIILNSLGTTYNKQGRYQEAESFLQISIEICKNSTENLSSEYNTALNNIALLYQNQNRYADAESIHQKILSVKLQNQGPDHLDTAITLNNLGYLFWQWGRYDEAEPYYLQALKILVNNLGFSHSRTAISYNGLGTVYYNLGRYSEAEPLLICALLTFQKVFGDEHPNVAMCLHNLNSFYQSQARYENALLFCKLALKIREEIFGMFHEYVERSLDDLAAIYYHLGCYEKSQQALERVLYIKRKTLGSNHPDTISRLFGLANFLEFQSRASEALMLYYSVLVLLEEHADIVNSPKLSAIKLQSISHIAEILKISR